MKDTIGETLVSLYLRLNGYFLVSGFIVHATHGPVLKMVLPEDLALAYKLGSPIDVEVPLADTHLFLRETGVAIR
jgi:hypothetical protein